nr:hypothetical protein GCM10020093_043400 [Planobispora longispora]
MGRRVERLNRTGQIEQVHLRQHQYDHPPGTAPRLVHDLHARTRSADVFRVAPDRHRTDQVSRSGKGGGPGANDGLPRGTGGMAGCLTDLRRYAWSRSGASVWPRWRREGR